MGFVDLSVDFPVLARPDCQATGLASQRTSVLAIVRRRGRLNLRKFLGDFLLFGGGSGDLALVVFRVFPRPHCQLAGLATPRDLVLVHLSDGEAGVTPVVFLADSFQSRRISTICWFCVHLGDSEAD